MATTYCALCLTVKAAKGFSTGPVDGKGTGEKTSNPYVSSAWDVRASPGRCVWLWKPSPRHVILSHGFSAALSASLKY